MSKNQNTNVEALPYFSQLKVQHLATKCSGSCGACDFTGCYGKERCAEIASERSEQ